MDQVCENWSALTSQAETKDVHIIEQENGILRIDLEIKQRDIYQCCSRAFEVSTLLQESPSGFTVLSTSTPCALPGGVSSFRCKSKSGKYMAVLKDVTDSTEKCHKGLSGVLEVWMSGGVCQLVSLPKSLHGKPRQGLVWSPDETHIAYVAEAKEPPSASFFSMAERKDVEEGVGDEHVYQDTFGEGLSGLREPRIFVVSVNHTIAKTHQRSEGCVLEVLPPSGEASAFTACTQPSFNPRGDAVVFTAFSTTRRLGLIYCINRPACVCVAKLQDAINATVASTHVTDHKNSYCWSGRFSSDGTSIHYLAIPGDEIMHRSPVSLCTLEAKSGLVTDAKCLVPAANPGPMRQQGGGAPVGFPGLFSLDLSSDCVMQGFIIASSFIRSRDVVLAINETTGELFCTHDLDDEEQQSWRLLTIGSSHLVCEKSSISRSPEIVVGRLLSVADCRFEWHVVDLFTRPALSPSMGQISHKVLTVSPSHTTNNSSTFECILCTPASPSPPQSTLPVILFPHGGPHSVFTTAHSMVVKFLVSSGFAVVLVNYRGSMGWSQETMQSLPGNVGSQDVSDVMDALSCALKADPALSSESVFLAGGSHGGFLVLHLIGQFPGRFRACSARNPVTNMASMQGTSDIADWCFAEALAEPLKLATPEILEQMFNQSPIKYVGEVITPLQLLLGECDLRCPPSQGLEYANALKLAAPATPLRILMYPENDHPLSKVPCETDHWLNTVRFFKWTRIIMVGADDNNVSKNV